MTTTISPLRPTASATVTPVRAPTGARRNLLRLELPGTVETLRRRRADLIATAFIDDYVALQWLEWHGGSLRLTVTARHRPEQIHALGRALGTLAGQRAA